MSGAGFLAEVDLPVAPEVVHAYLADPRNRPEWQSSLLSVDAPDVEPHVGLRWRERTAVGVRPRLEITEMDPPRTWAEHGRWRGVSATLRLVVSPAPGGSRVEARGRVEGAGAWAVPARLAGMLAGRAIASDLRRAGRILATRA